MKELVVISGKGGTGKTSIVASLAALAPNMVLADCDVDAADLHLVTEPQIQHREWFQAGKEAQIRETDCTGCGRCEELCQFEAVKMVNNKDGQTVFSINAISCEGCGVCVHFCPVQAIDFTEKTCGEWFVSQTRYGPMVHARLGIAQENSGKLVTLVRTEAKKIAEENNLDLVIIDGSPGIGCPVIASMTGASLVLIITEPTLSGLHDLQRVVKLAEHFRTSVVVGINKYDINPKVTQEIEAYCLKQNLPVVGKIPYDPVVTQAQLAGRSVVEYTNGHTADRIRNIWREIHKVIIAY